jgi:DNA-binding transcriptional ArsR family regulator
MVNNSKKLDSVFAALSDPTRRAILSQLAASDSTVTDLAKPHNMSLPAVSKHLTVLERAGLIRREKNGRVHRMKLRAEAMKDAAAWIAFYSKFWTEKLDALANYIEAIEKKKKD